MTNLPTERIAAGPARALPVQIVQPAPLESTCKVSPEQLRAAEAVAAREVRKAQALHKPADAQTSSP